MHDVRAWHESGLAVRLGGCLHADGRPGGFADTAPPAPGYASHYVGLTANSGAGDS